MSAPMSRLGVSAPLLVVPLELTPLGRCSTELPPPTRVGRRALQEPPPRIDL